MVELLVRGPDEADEVFHALAHSARRDMLRRLSDGDLTVGELSEPLAMSLAAASKHVKILESAGLVHRTIEGRRHVCRLDPAPLTSAGEWIRFYEQHWNARLDVLEDLMRSEPTPARQKPARRKPARRKPATS